MRNGHEDRRTAYSKRAIRESLYEIMKEKPLNKITVREICENADVNRSTFYAYYTDIYDLNSQILKDYFRCQHKMIAEAKKTFGSKPDITALTVDDFYKFFYFYFNMVKENKELFRFIFNQNTMPAIHVNLRKVFYRMLCSMLPEDIPEKIKEAFRISFIFESGGLTFIFMEWLNNDCVMPVETLAKRAAYFSNGVFNGYKQS